MKVTGRFNESDRSFSTSVRKEEKRSRMPHQELSFSKCENTYNRPLSRARVRAYITGVFAFLLSQVSQENYISLVFNRLQYRHK